MTAPSAINFTQFQRSGGGSAGNLSVPKPADTVVGEHVWIAAQSGNLGSAFEGDVFTLPAGFVEVARERAPGEHSHPEIVIGVRQVQASDPAAYLLGVNVGVGVIGAIWRSANGYAAAPAGESSGNNSGGTGVSSLVLESVNFGPDDRVVVIGNRHKAETAEVDHESMELLFAAEHSNNTNWAISAFSMTPAAAGSSGDVTYSIPTTLRMCAVMFVMRAVPPAPPEPDPETDFTAVDIEATATGYTMPFTVDGNDTVSAVAVQAGSSAPSATQIHEGKNAAGTVLPAGQRNSVQAIEDTASQISLSGLEYPIYDVYIAVGDNVESFPGELTLPPSGYLYQVVNLGGGAVPGESVLDADAAGNGSVGSDILEISATVSPQGVGVSATAKGGFELAGIITGRARIETRTYDYSAGGWHTESGVTAGQRKVWYINNGAPEEILPIAAQEWWTGIPIDPIRLGGVHVLDPEADSLSYTVDPALPAGITIELVVNQDGQYYQIQGTPEEDTEVDDDFTLTATDEATDTVDLTPVHITISTGVDAPDVDDGETSLEDAITAINGAGLSAGEITYDPYSEVEVGNIVASSPAGGDRVRPGTSVSLVVSGVPFTAMSPVFRNKVRVKITAGMELNYAVYPGGDAGSPRRGEIAEYTKTGVVVDSNRQIPFGSLTAGPGYVFVDGPDGRVWAGHRDFS